MLCMTTARQQLRNKHTGKPGHPGQFDGFTPAADQGITLTSYEVIDDDVDVFYDSPVETERVADVVTFEMGEENLVRDTNRLVGQEVARIGMPFTIVDEVAGEVIKAIYETAARYRAQGRVETIRGGFIRDLAKKKVSSVVDNHARHESSRGLRDWKLRAHDMEATLGRSLTQAEGDALAEEIRDNWHDKNHRPSKGFHRVVTFESINDEGSNAVNEMPAAHDTVEAIGGDRAHRLADLVEEKELTRVQARAQLWNVFAAEDNAPEAVPGWMNPFGVRQAKATVKDAVDVAAKWKQGLTTDQEEKALFAPFGNITAGEKNAVAETLLARPAYSHRMWVGALEFASHTDGYLA